MMLFIPSSDGSMLVDLSELSFVHQQVPIDDIMLIQVTTTLLCAHHFHI